MKVGVDGVLLGAWVDVSNAFTILDIGTGTGLIALMLAQRSDARITALEIERNAYHEACFNVSQSPWDDRVTVENISFQQFSQATSYKFSLIVSNPPFFENSQRAAEPMRSNARHNDLLPFTDLIKGCLKLMDTFSRLAIILPAAQAEKFIQLARSNGLFPSKITKVRPSFKKPHHRWLIELTVFSGEPEIDELSIESDSHFDYTPQYRELTKDYYLKF